MDHDDVFIHRRLASGIELAAAPIPGRRTTAFEIRMLAGIVDEPDDKLGLAHLICETIDLGTDKRSGQELSDAFDAIGAQVGSRTGRESFVFRCGCLPEYVEPAIELHAEMLRMPTFAEDVCSVALDLARQEITAMEDEPDELARKLIARHAFGPRLGRHALGERETLDRIGRDDVVGYWRSLFGARRMQVAIAGAVDVDAVADCLERHFARFGGGDGDGRATVPMEFSPGTRHFAKQLEQEYILLCWPGVPETHADQPIEEVTLAVLGGGMSSRLFTEVREKQGLVYWVGAWDEHPRGGGMVFMGASTTPQRCDQTYATLLREVDRLSEDVTEEELTRAKVGITAKRRTHGEVTRTRASELSADLFLHGRPLPRAEKDARTEAVTIADVRRYLHEHPRDALCVVTLGPRALGQS